MSMKFKINELIDKLQGKGYEIFETFTEKNGETLKAITERREAGVASPLIYLETLDGLTLEQAYALCDIILSTEAPDFMKDFDFSADYIKANIMPCLCHNSKVGGLYHEHAFADIEATFFVRYNDYIMRMKQDFFENLEIDEPLLPIAVDNLRGKTIRKDMCQLLAEMSGVPMPDCFEAPVSMIVISTENRQYGASAILIEKDNLQEGTILIPSSIHEFIALPQEADEEEPNIDELLEMVISTNVSVMESIDVLANNVYVIHNGNICELKEVI